MNDKRDELRPSWPNKKLKLLRVEQSLLYNHLDNTRSMPPLLYAAPAHDGLVLTGRFSNSYQIKLEHESLATTMQPALMASTLGKQQQPCGADTGHCSGFSTLVTVITITSTYDLTTQNKPATSNQ